MLIFPLFVPGKEFCDVSAAQSPELPGFQSRGQEAECRRVGKSATCPKERVLQRAVGKGARISLRGRSVSRSPLHKHRKSTARVRTKAGPQEDRRVFFSLTSAIPSFFVIFLQIRTLTDLKKI